MNKQNIGRGNHGKHAKGNKCHRWNNEKTISSTGYVKIRVGMSHPLADPNGYAYEHLVVWVSAGRMRPQKGQVIHHKDGNKTDNRIENLMIETISLHNKRHNQKRGRDKKGRFKSLTLDEKEHLELPEGF